MSEQIDVGDVRTLTVTVRDKAGALAASTLVLRVTKPDGTTVGITPIVNLSTGVYEAEFPLTMHGLWRYRWKGTNVEVAEQGSFVVQRQRVPDA